jgi:hypothetical protein
MGKYRKNCEECEQDQTIKGFKKWLDSLPKKEQKKLVEKVCSELTKNLDSFLLSSRNIN